MGRFLRRAHGRAAADGQPAGGSFGAADVSGAGRHGGRLTLCVAAVSTVAVLAFALYAGHAADAAGKGMKTADNGATAADPGILAPARPAASPSAGASQAALSGQAGSGQAGSGQAGRAAAGISAFRQIILPDLLIVAPKGLTAGQITSLRAISGVRNMITFDGAEITAGGRPVSVIGVNPDTFRSWVPLQTASNQAFWTALAGGEFVAGSATAKALALQPGGDYQLAGESAKVVRYGMAASLGLSGVDLLVNQATSARLGLVRQVAGLISAPGVSMATLTSEVSKVLGPSGRIEELRNQLPVTTVPSGTTPTTYIQLFQAAAADYCPGLSWTVLAAIGQIESADGTNMGPSSAGALGPMQFLPSTWASWGIDGFGQTGTPDVMNPYDAVASAARLLCADGAAAGGQSLSNAIFDYNHATWYVNEVLGLAAEYAADYPAS
ncbi:MAG TPA: lytic murein transglycosylase [Streptosporangiaceae bacterium]|nr:lytic murein transglycosylase [Streptosporangiaceae bacterium]